MEKINNREFTDECSALEKHGNIERKHLHRYNSALQISDEKAVLDIASNNELTEV